MLFGLGLIIVAFFAGYWFADKAVDKNKDSQKVEQSLSDRNTEWYNFIKSYLKVSKNKDEKAIVSRMLKDVRDQGLVDETSVIVETFSYPEDTAEDEQNTLSSSQNTAQVSATTQAVDDSTSLFDAKKAKLDNISLLLYFGAFLFIASMGLFVAFGNINGSLKTLIILVMGLLLYGLGCWLYQTKPTLKIVGVAFAGIGMAIIPLVGVAAYTYIFGQTQAPLAWFGTSIMVLFVYAHALWLFKNSVMNYVFIFSTLSLFESMVSVVSAPIYYFGWVMAISGIVLTIVAAYANIWPGFKESARQSGQIFVPISVIASILIVGKTGFWQLGVTLLLANSYSLMQFILVEDEEREYYLSSSQVLAISSLGVFVYALTKNIQSVGLVVMIASAVQALAFGMRKWPAIRMENYSNIVLVVAIISIFLSIGRPLQVLVGLLVLVLESYALWVLQKRNDAYVLASIALTIVPVVIGQYLCSPRVSVDTQTILLFVPLAIQSLFIATIIRPDEDRQFFETASALLLINVALIVFVGLFANPLLYILLISMLIAIIGTIYLIDHDRIWLYTVSLLTLAPLGRTLLLNKELFYAFIIGLLINIVIAIRTRLEFSRWVGTIIWLLMPVAVVHTGALDVTLVNYSRLYFVVAVGLLVARTIARGIFFFSDKKVLASYARNASLSYLYGLLLASVISVSFAAIAGDSLLLASVLGGISVILVLLGGYIEKHSLYFAGLPFLLQWIIWLVADPAKGDAASIVSFVILSILLAIGLFVASTAIIFPKYKGSEDTNEVLQLSSLASGMVVPFSVVVLGNNPAISIGFIAIILAFLYKYRHEMQSTKEFIIALAVLGIMWFMCAVHVSEIQAYSHVLVVMFAAFAVWRYYRGEKDQSDSYIVAAVVTATGPLLLQALSGVSGGLYGWWLLVEQIVIMIIGFAINSKFMVRWGLYVAVGSVLYQLRSLGWAALSLLAVFVIGVAIYEIQKINKN